MSLSKRKKREAERNRQINLQKNRERINRICKNKKAYDTEIEADGYAKLYIDPRYARNKRNKIRGKLRAYFCPFCFKWHLTSQPKRSKILENSN